MTDMIHDESTRSADAGVSADVATMFPVDDTDLSKLHDRLTSAANRDGLLEIAYRTIDSPIGPLLLATTNEGLVRVAFECEEFDTVLEELATKISPRVLEAPQALDAVTAELDEYFDGERHTFDVPLDYTLSSGFRQIVQQYLPHISYGHTQSYKQVAENVGNPKAVRAVGTACATNPIPVIVPCHRVLRTDGSLGGYLGGLEAKKTLLTLEQAA